MQNCLIPGQPASLPEIQTAHAGSMGLLAALHALCFTPGWSERDMARLLAMPGSMGLIAVRSEPVGFLVGRQVAQEAEIISIGVIPAARSAGMATALLNDYFARLSAQQIAEVFLEVAVDNYPAIALYATQGFTDVGRRPDYYTTAGKNAIRTDAIVMRRRLSGTKPASENGNSTGD